jgi:hypothetical protein
MQERNAQHKTKYILMLKLDIFNPDSIALLIKAGPGSSPRKPLY